MTSLDDIDLESGEDNEIDIRSLYTGKKDEYLQNNEALESLKIECDSLIAQAAISIGISSIAISLMPMFPPIALAALFVGGLSGEYLIRVGRLYEVTKLLLEHFGNEGIKITPRVKTAEGIIDLFIKMPDKRAFALTLRSKGTAQVKWREDRQDFCISQKGNKGKKKINKWSDLLKESQKSEKIVRILKQQKSQILGTSNTERNKSVIKAIVLLGKTEIDSNNNPSLFVDFGKARVLRVQTSVVTYVVNQGDLINFLLPPE
jgi:hypothetical protein